MPIRTKLCAGPCGQVKLLKRDFWRDSRRPDGYFDRCIDCENAVREERRRRRESGELGPYFSEEERQRRRERALELHRQGRLGGPEFGRLGGRAAKPRMTDAVIAHFAEPDKQALVVKAFEASLRSKNHNTKLKAAQALIDLEQRDVEVKLKQRGAGKDPGEMTMEELEEFVAQGLAAMIESGDLDLSTIDLPDSAVQEVA